MIDAAASSSPLVSVLIVNYNSGPNLARCLAALADQTMDDFEVIVVDNGSADRSVASIARAPTALTLDLAGGNLGFAAGINRAAGQARGRWLALLNPDAFAAPGWLAALLSASGRYPAPVMFASLQRQEAAPAYLDGAGDPYHVLGAAWRGGAGRRPPAPLSEGAVFGACGAAMFLPRDLFTRLGGFEESFFCYYEDVDFAFRAQLGGIPTVLVPSAEVRHIGSPAGAAASEFVVRHVVRNRLRTWLRNMPAPLLWPALPLVAINELLGLVRAWRHGQGGARVAALAEVVSQPAELWRQRQRIQRSRTASVRAVAAALTWSPWALWRRAIDLRPIPPKDMCLTPPATDPTTARVAAVIVTYDPDTDLSETLMRLTGQVAHVWVVDNGSEAPARARVRAAVMAAGRHATLIENDPNRGLGAAQNQGIAAALAADMDWVLTLDHDSLPAADMVPRLLAGVAADPAPARVGMAVPRLFDPDGSVDAPLYLAGSAGWVRRLRLDPAVTVSGVAFAAASGSLISADALRRVGNMRAAFFVDYIDIDFCFRLRRAGLTIRAVGAAGLRHRFGSVADDGRRQAHPAARLHTIYRNRVTLWREYGARWPGYIMFEGAAVGRDILRVATREPKRRAKLLAMIRGTWAGLTGREAADRHEPV